METENLFDIKNKIIVITGAGRGIGHMFATSMAKHHAYVYCFDINFPVEIPAKLSKNLFYVKCDLIDSKKFLMNCKKIYTKHKKIDVLINNLGVTIPNNSENSYSEKDWNETIRINLTTSFNCSQIVMPFMKKQKSGSIINITSINAEFGFPNNPAYIASKGGLKMLGKSMAKDWGKFGIRVNNLGPGYFKTTMNKKSWNNLKTRKIRTIRTMLNRWGETNELVGPCIFLASNASSYVTGQDIYVDGGWSANGLS
jgi:NAD(P)-dependent dehydrogenase (short-subunit alcohol dehydrogenase family)